MHPFLKNLRSIRLKVNNTNLNNQKDGKSKKTVAQLKQLLVNVKIILVNALVIATANVMKKNSCC